MSSKTVISEASLRISLGGRLLGVGLPVLSGDTEEAIFPEAEASGRAGDFSLYRAGSWLLGAAQARANEEPEMAAQRIYGALFSAVGDCAPIRIWNYVPQINLKGAGGLENYRAFCRGRSHAFEQHYGSDFKKNLSSASAVGTDADVLTVIFAATQQPVQHFENPRQLAAYDYPPEYGPRSPSFARATVVSGSHQRDVFISGTAAIRGHASITGGIDTQLACTLENLQLIGTASGIGETLGIERAPTRHFKIYLRHAHDLASVRATLERSLLTPTDHVTYVRSDVCRAELDVEIEATILGLK